MRRVGALVAATAALFAQGIAGATAAAPAPAIATEADDPRLDAARRGVRAAAEWMASGIDSWFGNIPFKDGGSVSDGRLSLSLTKRQGEDLEHKLRFDARFKLPNVEASTYLFIGRDNPRELVTDTPAGLSQQRRLLPDSREPSFATEYSQKTPSVLVNIFRLVLIKTRQI